MHYEGVVLSDDLGMKAVSATTSLGEAAVGAIQAGCDAVLLCNSTVEAQAVALEALIHAAESGALPLTRLDDAFGRQRDAKVRLRTGVGQPDVPLDRVGSPEHLALAEEMAGWR
jgi:beta-N-acetylhexosaminidase